MSFGPEWSAIILFEVREENIRIIIKPRVIGYAGEIVSEVNVRVLENRTTFIYKVSMERDMCNIEGQVILNVQDLFGKEGNEALDWTVNLSSECTVLELADGSLLIPVNDIEGNRPGNFQTKSLDKFDDIAGSKITNLAPMSEEAMEYRDWDSSGYRPPVLTLDMGGQLYPVADPEGNQFGVLFRVQNGDTYIVDFEIPERK